MRCFLKTYSQPVENGDWDVVDFRFLIPGFSFPLLRNQRFTSLPVWGTELHMEATRFTLHFSLHLLTCTLSDSVHGFDTTIYMEPGMRHSHVWPSATKVWYCINAEKLLACSSGLGLDSLRREGDCKSQHTVGTGSISSSFCSILLPLDGVWGRGPALQQRGHILEGASETIRDKIARKL